MMHYVIPLLFLTSMFLSGTSVAQPNEVKVEGSLKAIMRHNDIGPKIDLQTLSEHEHLYALGALAHLQGEVIIWDGGVRIAKVQDRTVRIDSNVRHKATLLVYTSVSEWTECHLPDTVQSVDELQIHLKAMAQQEGISSPFAFRIEGVVDHLDWHVIDWPEGDAVHTHSKHKTSGMNGTIDGRSVQLLGFYSEVHHGIFTHHRSDMHIHFKTADEQLAGHVDELFLGESMKLFLPSVK